MSFQGSTGPGARRRVSKHWVVEYLGPDHAARVHRFRYHFEREPQSLDSHVRKWPMVSSRGGLYVVETRSLAEDIRLAVRLALRRWSYDGYQRRRRVREFLELGISRRLKVGRRLSFVTLPFPGADAYDLWAAFRLLVKQLRRRQGSVEFCGVRATGSRSGVMHVHVVMDMGYLAGGQAELSRLWKGLTGYGVVDIREVKSTSVVEYIARQVSGYVADQGTGRVLKSKGWCDGVGEDSSQDAQGGSERGAESSAVGAAGEVGGPAA